MSLSVGAPLQGLQFRMLAFVALVTGHLSVLPFPVVTTLPAVAIQPFLEAQMDNFDTSSVKDPGSSSLSSH